MKEFKIDKFDTNQRIDKYIKKMLPSASLSLIYKAFRKKDIKVNNHWVKQEYILQENDVIKIYINDEVFKESEEAKKVENIKFNLDIVYEDENILVLNKDKGILVHGDKNEKIYTLSNEVISYLYNKKEYNPKENNFIPSPVHRLDRNTSGIIVFAKNMITSKQLMEEFKTKDNLEKHYVALTFGDSSDSGKIDAPLRKESDKNLVFVDYASPLSKEALTLYNKIDGNYQYSLLDVTLITGRTHQIRVHLSYIDLPIVGDSKYGNFLLNKQFSKEYKYEKQFLHAYSLKFKNLSGHLSYLSNKRFVANLKKEEIDILNKLNLKFRSK